EAVGDVDRLVADVAEVAGAVAQEDLEDLPQPRRAREGGDGAVGPLRVPVVHRLHEAGLRLVGGGEPGLLDRPHAPVAPALVARLRGLEVVDRPEQRQPAVPVRRGQGGLVGGVDHQHRVELEADGPRLDAPDPRQEHGREQVLVAGALVDLGGHLRHEVLARRVLDQLDQGLDLPVQTDQPAPDGVGGGGGGQGGGGGGGGRRGGGGGGRGGQVPGGGRGPGPPPRRSRIVAG